MTPEQIEQAGKFLAEITDVEVEFLPVAAARDLLALLPLNDKEMVEAGVGGYCLVHTPGRLRIDVPPGHPLSGHGHLVLKYDQATGVPERLCLTEAFSTPAGTANGAPFSYAPKLPEPA